MDNATRELLDQIKVWQRERDQLDDLIDDAYARVDEITEVTG